MMFGLKGLRIAYLGTVVLHKDVRVAEKCGDGRTCMKDGETVTLV